MAYKSWLIGELVIEERITSFLRNKDTLTESLLWMIGGDVRDDASRNAPKDTRALSESISITTNKRSDYTIRTNIAQRLRVEARIAPKSIPPSNAVDIHAAVHYATFQELGWTDRSGGSHPGRPFMIPALETLADSLKARFSVALSQFMPGLQVRKQVIRT